MTDHAAEAAHHAAEGAHHATAGVKGALGKKLGPMPVGGWLLAVAGGVGVALFFRNRSAGNDPAGDTTLPTDPPGDFTANDGFDQADPGGTNQGVGGGIDTGGNVTTPGTPAHRHHDQAWQAKHATTNGQWRQHAVQAMTAMGFHAAAVDNALARYLAGEKLTQPQELLVSATLARCGPPPRAPRHPGPGTGGVHTPPTKPPIHHP